MKKYFVYIISSTLLLGSCKKYLDKEPDNRTQVKTPDQIAQLLTTAYPQGNYILFTEAMSDNAEDKGLINSGIEYADQINRDAYRFEDSKVSPDNPDCPAFYWNACYKAIAAANQALEFINNAADTTVLNPHKGEALLARAYAHFMLVSLFAKTYDPNTAANDPGIPYVTVPEKTTFQQYERKTVAYVYEMIEKDFLTGYPLIDDRIYGNAPRFHFNKKAAAAFGARLYLFKQEYDKVVSYANTALGQSPAEELRPWNSAQWGAFQYAELESQYTKSETPGNLLLQETNSIWGRSYFSFRYGLGLSVANRLFFNTNVTGGTYAMPVYGTSQAYNVPKFYEFFVKETISASIGDPYNTIPLLTSEEALLNRAEAYLLRGNLSSSIADMNAFASKTIDNYSSSTNNITSSKLQNYYGTNNVGLAAISAILDFKSAFFIQEGLRWFDMQRWGIPVSHTTTTGEQISIPADDNRRVLQLPPLTVQAGLEPNPR
jgi:starch-binding outer membrane protein, SusD/RagB family